MKTNIKRRIATILGVACLALTTVFSHSITALADEEDFVYSEGALYQSYRTSKTEQTSVQIDFELNMPEHFAYDVYADLMNINNGDTYKFSITSANGYTDRAWIEPGDYKLLQVYVHGDNVGAYPFAWDANTISFEAGDVHKFSPTFVYFDKVTEEIDEAYKQREEDFGIDPLGNIIDSKEPEVEEPEIVYDDSDFDKNTTPFMTQSRAESGKVWIIGETDDTYNLKVEITTIDEKVLPKKIDENGNEVPNYPEVPGTYFKVAYDDVYDNFSVYIDGEPVTTEVYTVPLSGFYELDSDITLYFDASEGDFQVGDTFTAYVLSYENVVIQTYEGEGHTDWELTPKNGKTLFDALCDSDINLVIRIEKSGDAGTAVWSISEDGGNTFKEQEYAKEVLEFDDFTITFKRNTMDTCMFVKGGTFTFTYEMPEVELPFSGASIVALILVGAVVVGGYIFINKKMKSNMPKDTQYTINR